MHKLAQTLDLVLLRVQILYAPLSNTEDNNISRIYNKTSEKGSILG